MSIAETLGQLALFADLTPSQLEAIAHSHEEDVFAAGERVLRRGLSGGNFYVILEGEAAVEIGGEARHQLMRGDFFGEISALTGEAPTAAGGARGRRGRDDDAPLPRDPGSAARAPAARPAAADAAHAADGSAAAAEHARVAAVERPFPPGDYDVVVVGSGPGGLQTSYCLRRLGIRHALLSRDERPGGMFQRYPIFQRLITWTKPDAPVERGSREYEWYDHNSLVADEPELKALVPALMDRGYDLPSRGEMEAGLAAFAERARLEVRYGCTWESTRYEGEQLVLETSDGEYRCRAAVFALGVTVPWRAAVPGLEHAAHYVDTERPERYAGRDVFVVGKRNSGFEVAQGILPWARSIAANAAASICVR